MKNLFTNYIRQKIKDSQIEQALAVLADFLENQDESLHQEIILHQSNWSRTKHDVELKLIKHEEFETNEMQISYAVLTMLNDIESLKFDDEKAVIKGKEVAKRVEDRDSKIDTVFKNQQRSRKIYLWSGIGLILVALSIFGVIQYKKPSKEVQAETIYQAAKNARHLEDLDQTIKLTSQAINLDPKRYDFLNLRAECYMLKRKLNSARADIEAALRLEPNEPGYIYSTMAQIESLSGNTEGFYLYFEKAMQYHIPMWDYVEEIGIAEHSKEARFSNIVNEYKNGEPIKTDSIHLK